MLLRSSGSLVPISITQVTEKGSLSMAKKNANGKKTEIFQTCLGKSMKFQGLKQTDFDEFRNIELVLELKLQKSKYKGLADCENLISRHL